MARSAETFFVRPALHLSLLKTFPIKERVTANLRLDAFNSLNRANLNAPSGGMTNNNFGKVTGADPGRVYQVSLLLRF
jgi:hypothetical protein